MIEYVFPAESLYGGTVVRGASLMPCWHQKDLGTNVNRLHLNYNAIDLYEQHGKMLMPSDLDTSGIVTFAATWIPEQSGNNIQWRVRHAAVAAGEDFDIAFTDFDSGDISIPTDSTIQLYAEWTETVSNLGWAAEDVVYFAVKYISASGSSNLGGMDLTAFRFSIPTS